MMSGSRSLFGMWLVFAPGAAVGGVLRGCLLLWVGRRVRSQVALHRRGLAWGTRLGLLVAPVEPPRLLGDYYAMMGAHTRTETEH